MTRLNFRGKKTCGKNDRRAWECDLNCVLLILPKTIIHQRDNHSTGGC